MPTFGSVTTATGTDASFAGPTVTGTDILGVVVVHHGVNAGPGTVESVTWGGVAMVRVTPSAARRVHVFKLPSPSSGGTVVVSDTPLLNAPVVVAAMYWSDADDVIQTADGSSSGGTEATATVGSATTSGNVLALFGTYWGAGVNTSLLINWEVNGSTVGVVEAYTIGVNAGANDVLGAGGYDDDGATGGTDSMSVTPDSDTENLDVTIIEISAATGGTNFTRSQTDAAGLADSETQESAALRAPADSEPLTDTTAQVAESSRSQTDAFGLTDSVTAETSNQQTLTDSLGLTDSASYEHEQAGERTATDPLGLTDSIAVSGDTSLTETDALGLTDTVEAGLLIEVSVTDTTTAADAAAQAGGYQPTITDGQGLADVAARSVGFFRDINDGLPLSDSVSRDLVGIDALFVEFGSPAGATVEQASLAVLVEGA